MAFACDSYKAILHISQLLTVLTKQFVFAYVSMLKCGFFCIAVIRDKCAGMEEREHLLSRLHLLGVN